MLHKRSAATKKTSKPTSGRNKFNSKKTIIDGITFDSKKESERYLVLKDLEKSNKISELELQKKFVIVPGCVIAGRKRPPRYYKADFYYLNDKGERITEDCKGKKTDMYSLKRHLMKAINGIDILET